MKQKKAIVNKLRSSGLRPTKQRVLIAQNLFERDKTFHFTVETLNKEINKKVVTKFLWLQYITQLKHLQKLDT